MPTFVLSQATTTEKESDPLQIIDFPFTPQGWWLNVDPKEVPMYYESGGAKASDDPYVITEYLDDDDYMSLGTSTRESAQTIATTTDGIYVFSSTTLKAIRVGTTSLLHAELQETDGSNKPNGVILATGTIDVSTLSSVSPEEIYIPMSTTTVYGNTLYAIVVFEDNEYGDTNNKVRIRVDASSPTYTEGQNCFSDNGGSSWTCYAYDEYFIAYGVETEAVEETYDEEVEYGITLGFGICLFLFSFVIFKDNFTRV